MEKSVIIEKLVNVIKSCDEATLEKLSNVLNNKETKEDIMPTAIMDTKNVSCSSGYIIYKTEDNLLHVFNTHDNGMHRYYPWKHKGTPIGVIIKYDYDNKIATIVSLKEMAREWDGVIWGRWGAIEGRLESAETVAAKRLGDEYPNLNWHLPSIYEWQEISEHDIFDANYALNQVYSPKIVGEYWSSTTTEEMLRGYKEKMAYYYKINSKSGEPTVEKQTANICESTVRAFAKVKIYDGK